ncbi:MAG: o-succinylbenzoate synthase [Acidimicrobiaceae bacterium]|nr:o-succinylbenzoate synthase [Acidimicrobiaceae bacterium]
MTASTLDAVELVRVRLPLVEPWVTAAGTVTERDALLVRVQVGGVEGWGECVAEAAPTYSSEYVDGAWDVLRRFLIPALLAAEPCAGAEVAPALAGFKGHRMAKAALEAAVLDAELRGAGVSMAEHLWSCSTWRPPGGPAPKRPHRVASGVAVGISGSVPQLLAEVSRRVDEGYRRVKLKVHPGWDVEPVGAVREAFADLALQVDANGAYAAMGSAASAAVKELDRFGLLLVEQPLADDDLVGHAALAEAISTPVCLDESIVSFETAEAALALGACSVVNIKAGRVGGYLEAVRIHDLCAAAGVPVWCGGMLETGVGRAANLALATLANFALPGDLSASGRFWAADVVRDPIRLEADGTIRVPDGPGSGAEVIDLAPWTLRRCRLG